MFRGLHVLMAGLVIVAAIGLATSVLNRAEAKTSASIAATADNQDH